MSTRAHTAPSPRTRPSGIAQAGERDEREVPLRARYGWAVWLYETFYSAAIGGSTIALFFLAVDVARGRPFYTPALMGTLLFRAGEAEQVTGTELDMVAYYTVVHMALFTIVGGVIAGIVHWVKLLSHRPAFVLAVLFAILDVGFLAMAALLMPAVVGWLGTLWIMLANLCAAATMTWFFAWSHRRMG